MERNNETYFMYIDTEGDAIPMQQRRYVTRQLVDLAIADIEELEAKTAPQSSASFLD